MRQQTLYRLQKYSLAKDLHIDLLGKLLKKEVQKFIRDHLDDDPLTIRSHHHRSYKKYKIKDGGNMFLLAATSFNGPHLILCTSEILFKPPHTWIK